MHHTDGAPHSTWNSTISPFANEISIEKRGNALCFHWCSRECNSNALRISIINYFFPFFFLGSLIRLKAGRRLYNFFFTFFIFKMKFHFTLNEHNEKQINIWTPAAFCLMTLHGILTNCHCILWGEWAAFVLMHFNFQFECELHFKFLN